MKINSLKFRQLTNVIGNKSLRLNLFDKSDKLFEQVASKTTMRCLKTINNFSLGKKHKARPKTNQKKRLTSSKIKSQVEHQDIFFYLRKCLLNYIEYITNEQKKSIKKQIHLLLHEIREESHYPLVDRLNSLQSNLSKRFKNRLMHLVFYLILNKIQSLDSQRDIEKEIKNYVLCQYYSRKFNFKELTLAICIELQEIYCLASKYQLSRMYARKALKLSVVLSNQFEENKMIEALYILNYYEGRLNEKVHHLLTHEQRKRILESYDEKNQAPNIFGMEDQPRTEHLHTQFTLEHNNNFIENSIANKNIRYFQSNYHEIIKTIPDKSINVRNIMNKVSSVGVLKKYFAKDNYITIKPECHVIRPINQEQVLITHKKEPTSEKNMFIQKLTKRVADLLEVVMSEYEFR